MRSDGKRVTREASRATGTFLFFPKGALTHHPGGAVVFPLEIVLSSPRQEPPSAVALRNAPAGAVRGGCGFFGSLMDNATALRIYCHCPRSWWNTVASADGIPPTARTNLPLHKVRPSGVAALSAVMTISIADSHFLFHKEKQKLYERMEMTKWQSIIWKPK